MQNLVSTQAGNFLQCQGETVRCYYPITTQAQTIHESPFDAPDALQRTATLTNPSRFGSGKITGLEADEGHGFKLQIGHDQLAGIMVFIPDKLDNGCILRKMLTVVRRALPCHEAHLCQAVKVVNIGPKISLEELAGIVVKGFGR